MDLWLVCIVATRRRIPRDGSEEEEAQRQAAKPREDHATGRKK